MEDIGKVGTTSARGFNVFRWWLVSKVSGPFPEYTICPVIISDDGEVKQIRLDYERKGREPVTGVLVGEYWWEDDVLRYAIDEWAWEWVKTYGE